MRIGKEIFRLAACLPFLGCSRATNYGSDFLNPGMSNALAELSPGDGSNFTLTFTSDNLVRDSNLVTRQRRCVNPGYVPCPTETGCCPAGDTCVTGGCCPAGEILCPGTTKCYSPGTEKCCQQGGKIWGCPINKECCSMGYCYTPSTERCCTNGSCPMEDTCCANECCRPLAYCGSNGFCSARATPTLNPTTNPQPNLTSRLTRNTSSSRPTQSIPSSSVVSTKTRVSCPTGLTERDDTAGLGKRQRPFSKCCLEETQTDGSNLPVWELSRVAGETDELIRSMCAGIEASQARRKINEPNYEPVDGEDLLTYAGGRGERGKQSDCTPFCRDANRGRSWANRLQCDEYPPASFYEGGAFSSRMCVPWYQNSGTQGPMLSRVLAVCRLRRGDQIKVRIKGGCKSYKVPRQADQTGDMAQIDLTGTNSSLRDPYGDGSLTYVGLSLGQLPFGKYDVSLLTDGQIEGAIVVNSAGDEYASMINSTNKGILSFKVDDDSQSGLALIAFTSTQINIQYNTTVNGTTKESSSSQLEFSMLYVFTTGIATSIFLACISS